VLMCVAATHESLVVLLCAVLLSIRQQRMSTTR
jgi:hypothetical protein